MKKTFELEKNLLEHTAEQAGIVHFGYGMPHHYDQTVRGKGVSLVTLAGFEPILMLAFGEPYEIEAQCQPRKGRLHVGEVSPMAGSHDYHRVMHHKAACWLEKLEKTIGPLQSKICVDTTPLLDRTAAEICGLGQRGQNEFLIHPQMGTAWNIGVLLLAGEGLRPVLDELQVPVNPLTVQKQYFRCSECRACSTMCPSKAIQEGEPFQRDLCLSAVTQRRGTLTEDEMNLMGSRLYGCDVCQTVCPSNKQYGTFVSTAEVDLLEILRLTKSSYKKAYENTGFYWRGLTIMKRNALIALGNQSIDQEDRVSLVVQGEDFVLAYKGSAYQLNRNLLPFAERWASKNNCFVRE